MCIVCEGVETEQKHGLLVEFGFVTMQGKPVRRTRTTPIRPTDGSLDCDGSAFRQGSSRFISGAFCRV